MRILILLVGMAMAAGAQSNPPPGGWKTVMADTNGVVRSPSNFVAANGLGPMVTNAIRLQGVAPVTVTISQVTNCTISYTPRVVQTVCAVFTNHASASSVIPADDTIPQISEGYQTITATITPLESTNMLLIRVSGPVYSGGTIFCTYALFRDSNADAIGAGGETISAAQIRRVNAAAYVAAVTNRAQVISARVGSASAGTYYLNGNMSTRYFGGINQHVLEITEIKP